jgi:hypothetical protein
VQFCVTKSIELTKKQIFIVCQLMEGLHTSNMLIIHGNCEKDMYPLSTGTIEIELIKYGVATQILITNKGK